MDTPTALTTLDHFSDQSATTIAAAGASVVAVDGGGRWGCSSIVWRPGIIVTADHMLADDDVKLTLPDGRTISGSVQGRDSGTDVALVRVNDADVDSAVRPAPLEGVRVGHLSFAIARDDDNDVSASMGIVSVVGTAWHTRRGGTIDRFLRADVSLTPRFSGGPLIDAAGRVIGMNTLGLSRRMGLTVPAVVINRIVEQLLVRGRVMRGFLGIATQFIYDGVIILSVAPRSPAERAGLLVGDVLVAAETKRILDPDDLIDARTKGTGGEDRRLIAATTAVLVTVISASPTIRSGLFALLEQEPALAMVETGDNADVALVDRMFDSSVREATIGGDRIARVLLVADPTFDTATRALRAGFRAVVSIDAPSTEITAAILAAHAGFIAFPAFIAESFIGAISLNSASTDGRGVLTQREREVFQLVGEGHANKQIAQRLSISEHTAKFHVSSILSKLGVETRTDAVRLGIKSGLIAL